LEGLGIYALGFLGQALFGARLVVQLFRSEREKRVVSPVVFWQLSLAASFVFLIYGLLRHDAVIILGQTLSYFIYVRNLQLKKAWTSIHIILRSFLIILPFIAIAWALVFAWPEFNGISMKDYFGNPIMVIGAIGQLALNLRFIYQWHYSELRKDSVLPIGFWHISTWASVLVIIYALFHPIHGTDPVLLVSQGLGIFVYIRNIVIYHKQTRIP
jgi:lipid-A-disaccharide synthase-like uncharacterized protein